MIPPGNLRVASSSPAPPSSMPRQNKPYHLSDSPCRSPAPSGEWSDWAYLPGQAPVRTSGCWSSCPLIPPGSSHNNDCPDKKQSDSNPPPHNHNPWECIFIHSQPILQHSRHIYRQADNILLLPDILRIYEISL